MKVKKDNDKLLKISMKKMEDKRLNKLKRRGIDKLESVKHLNLQDLVQDATNRGLVHEKSSIVQKSISRAVCTENSAKLFASEVRQVHFLLKQVIEQSDIIIEVIDARDPIGSRSKQIEAQVMARGSSKRLVILMNKIDLIPADVAMEWLRTLRRQLPTIPFKASTQEQTKRLGRFNDFYTLGDSEFRSSKCSGADLLLRLLGNYCRCKDIRTRITVGVVGFPNTGKSSVINSLKRNVVCNVGLAAGVTRSLQKVELSKYIQLIDSPGVVLKSEKDDPLKSVLANCVCPQRIFDPEVVAEEIVRLLPPDEAFRVYGIDKVGSADRFLHELAMKKGLIRQGGLPNLEATALSLLRDWNEGRITHYVPVPSEISDEDMRHVDSRIVSEMSKEFDIDALCSFEDMEVEL